MGLVARHSRLSAYLAAAVVYAAVLLWCFHGVFAHPGSRIVYGFGDGTSTLRGYWAASVQHRDPFNFTSDALMGAPQGTAQTPAIVLANGGVQAGFVWELRGALGLVGAWNAFMLLGLFATALGMFALLEWLGCTFGASLLGGYVFGFSPYDLERAYAGHLGLLQNWVFVLLAYALLRLRGGRSLRSSALAGAAIALAFYNSAYEGLLAGLMTLVFLLVELVRLGGRRERLGTVGLGAFAYLSGLAAMTPIFVLYAREHAAVVEATAQRANDLYTYSAQLSAYLVPSPRNPLFHWVRGFHSNDLTEQTLFFGYSTLLLALAAVVLLVRRDGWLTASQGRRWTAIFAAVLAPAALLLSLPPSYRVGSLTIPMPSKSIGLFTSFWRVYSRFGLLVGFALATLAALALSALAVRGGRWRLLTPIALLVAFLELLPGNVSALNTNAKAQPAWVRYLAAQPRGIVATYPSLNNSEAFIGDTLATDAGWYQIFDRDPEFNLPDLEPLLANGGRNVAIRLLASGSFWNPLTARVLATEGVRYVVINDDAFRPDGLSVPTLDPTYYTLLRRFGDVRIFSVRAPMVNITLALRASVAELMALQGLTNPVLCYGSGFQDVESYHGAPSRWLIQDGQLTLANGAAAMSVTISGKGFSAHEPRLVELIDSSGSVLGRQLFSTNDGPISYGPFPLPPGTSTLTLVAIPGPEPLAPSDPRNASVFLEPLSVNATPAYIAQPSSP